MSQQSAMARLQSLPDGELEDLANLRLEHARCVLQYVSGDFNNREEGDSRPSDHVLGGAIQAAESLLSDAGAAYQELLVREHRNQGGRQK